MKTNFGVFYCRPNYETRRIIKEGQRQGLAVVEIDRRQLRFRFHQKAAAAFYHGRPLPYCRWAVLRTGVVEKMTATAVRNQRQLLLAVLRQQGTRVLNGSSLWNDLHTGKMWQLSRLATAGLPVIESTVWSSSALISDEYFSSTRVLKAASLDQGEGVWRVYSAKEAKSLVQRYSVGELIGQPFYPGGRDVRILVLGRRCLGAMERRAPSGDFRSNIAVGGVAKAIPVDSIMRKLALAAARATGMEFCGVDLLPTHEGFKILEVNRFAQFQGFERATGVNVAGEIVKHLAVVTASIAFR